MPLSRLPVGELFSGLFMGLVLPFLAIYINAPPDALVTLSYTEGVLGIGLVLPALVRLGIACIPAMMGIAGIMLANNICDLPADRAVGRYTLPHFIGLRAAKVLFAGLYVVSFLSIPAMVIAGALPVWGVRRGFCAPLIEQCGFCLVIARRPRPAGSPLGGQQA